MLVNPQLIPTGKGWPIDTRANAISQNVPRVIQSIITSGYTTAGDGGGAEYKRVGAEPAHPGKFQSHDGAWWELTSNMLTLEMFGAKRDGVTIDSDAIDNAIACCQATKASGVYPLAGEYAINRTVTFNNEIRFRGAGKMRTVFNLVSAAVISAFTIDCPNNASIIGFDIGSFTVVCNAGAVVCDGFIIKSLLGFNSANSTSRLSDIFIRNCRRGVWLGGVTYMSNFDLITVVNCTEYGWYADGANWGDVTYNRFTNLEVTDTQDGAFSYFIRSNYSTFDELTCDGCWYISDPNGSINTITIEGMPHNPPVPSAGQINLIKTLLNPVFINIPTAKCNIALDIISVSTLVNGLSFPSGAQPDVPVYIRNTPQATGVFMNAEMTNCVAKRDKSDWGNITVINCYDITNYCFTYKEGDWTPTINTWQTAPTVFGANYTVNGAIVTVVIQGQGGKVGIPGPGVGYISGLPINSGAFSGGFMTINSNQTAGKTATGSIGQNNSIAGPFNDVDFTSDYWIAIGQYSIR